MSTVELRDLEEDERSDRFRASSRSNSHERHPEFSLPPVDGGKDAYLFLAAAFVVETLVWGMPAFRGLLTAEHLLNHSLGFPFAFGVFQEYFSTHAPFKGSRNIAVIGTCAMVSGLRSHHLVLILMFSGNHVSQRTARVCWSSEISDVSAARNWSRPGHDVSCFGS
jgi:hypothetical protein